MGQRGLARLILLAALAAIVFAAPALGAAPGVRFDLGDRIDSEIRPGDDLDPYSFDGAAGTRLSVTATGSGGLVPRLGLTAPDGSPLDLDGALRTGRSRAVLRRLELPATGRYTLTVGSADGAEGAYRLKTKGRPPRRFAFGPLSLGAGETCDLAAFGVGDASWLVRLKASKGAALRVGAILAPSGSPMPGGAAAFGSDGTARRATVELIGGFGEYRLRLVGGEEDVTVRAVVRVRLPKPPRRRTTLSGSEPRPAAVVPSRGQTGDRITVTGEGFAEGAEVWLGDSEAPLPLLVSESEITAEVPVPDRTDAALPILVRNPDGQSNELRDAFTVLVPPAVHSVSPAFAAPGEEVTVEGAGFSEGIEVDFGYAPAPHATLVSADLLVAEVPSGIPEGPTDVTVTIPEGLSGRKLAALVVEAPPAVVAVEPDEALPGETVRVLGDRFRDGSAVRFAGADSPAVSVLSTSEILARVPWGLSAGPADVTVVKPWGSERTLPSGLTVLEAPPYLGLLIAGVVDGPRSGGTPKAIELYATADIDDLSEWSIDVAINGGDWSGSPFVLSGSAKAGDFIRIASEGEEFESYFGFATDFVTSVAYVNGNDAFALLEGTTLRDVYGDPADVAGSTDRSAPWDHQDGFAYRRSGTGPSTLFDEGDWTLSGQNALDAQGSSGVNGDAGVTVPFGTYTESY